MPSQSDLAPVVLIKLQGVWLRVLRWFDVLWGYDVFIAHRRRDASKYAQALYDKLTAEKICCVVDRVVYGPGDSLLVTTQRHIAKSTVFLLVGSPELLIIRKPVDWVEREIVEYLNSHGTDPRVLIVDIGGTVENACAPSAFWDFQAHPIVSQLLQFLRIYQTSTALVEPPSDEVLAAVREQLDGRRRGQTRLRSLRTDTTITALLSLIWKAIKLNILRAIARILFVLAMLCLVVAMNFRFYPGSGRDPAILVTWMFYDGHAKSGAAVLAARYIPPRLPR